MAPVQLNARPQFPAPPITPFPDVQVFPKHRGEHTSPEFDYVDDDSDGELDLFASDDAFSAEHDVFIVRNWCFEPEVPLQELAIQFRRQFGLEKTAADLESRLETLQSEEFTALLALYLRVVAVDRDATESYTGAAATVKPAFLPLLRRLRPSCETRLLQLAYEDEKMNMEVSDTIPVEISSRNFPKYTRLVNKQQLMRCCKVVRDLFSSAERGSDVSMSPNRAYSLHGLRHGNDRLQFTDSATFYDSHAAFNHLEQPIFDRLAQFSKDMNVMERLSLQKQQLAEQKNIKWQLTHELQTIFSAQLKQQLEKLETRRVTECESIQQQLERVLEEDILHLRRMHESLLKHEHAKIHAKFDAQIATLNRQIAAMKQEVDALQQKCDSSGWTTLDHDIARTSLQVERIFGTSDYILRLLILSEDLDADPLRRALVRYLSKENTLPQFALRREFTSKIISESTILAILKGAPTLDLRELEDAGTKFAYHELVARELHTRKVTFSRFIAGLTNDQLRVVSRIKVDGLQSVLETADGEEFIDAEMVAEMKAVVEFPAVLDRELTRRREFSSVKMNSADVDREVSFSEDDCVLQLETSHRYCSVFATKERKQGESGRWMFEVTVEVFAGEGESILLGWEVPRHEDVGLDSITSESLPTPSHNAATGSSKPSFVPGLTPGADGRSFGVTWQSDGGLEMGMLHANGQSKSGIACFRAGDVISCTINQDELVPYLHFYLNGVQVIPSLSTSAAAASSPGIACQNPIYCLFPVVSMYSSRKKPQMRVRFNFRGNFRFPIVGFEPYGAPL